MPKPAANMRQEGGARSLWQLLGLAPGPNQLLAGDIVAAAAQASRQPLLYGEGRTPDTFGGRFEQAVLHSVLALRRLGGDRKLAQAFVNRLFSTFDEALREVGEGDLTVAKRMKGFAQAFYGRLAAYTAALEAGDEPALVQALSNNIWDVDAAPFAAALAQYVRSADRALADLSPSEIADPARWPAATV